jgi:hypothetical protein
MLSKIRANARANSFNMYRVLKNEPFGEFDDLIVVETWANSSFL